jgi:hypothetical protein
VYARVATNAIVNSPIRITISYWTAIDHGTPIPVGQWCLSDSFNAVGHFFVQHGHFSFVLVEFGLFFFSVLIVHGA